MHDVVCPSYTDYFTLIVTTNFGRFFTEKIKEIHVKLDGYEGCH